MNGQRLRMPGITDLPVSMPGMRIGLFGGSFNPAHDGHRLVSRQVLKRLELDAVWWLVSPGNPLKNHDGLAPLQDRVLAARALIEQPKIHVTGFEAAHGFRFTYDTLRYLKATLPGRRLVWIMGADSLRDFHLWEHWQRIMRMVPMAVYVRPGVSRALASKAATRFARYRVDEDDAALLPDLEPPAWVYLHGIMSGLSSTEIRAGHAASALK